MKLFISGKGGELCIGKLSEDQEDFVFSNAEDEDCLLYTSPSPRD